MAGEILRVSSEQSAELLSGELRWGAAQTAPARNERIKRCFRPKSDGVVPSAISLIKKLAASEEDRVVVQRRVVLFGSQRPGAVRANRQFRWAIWWVMMVSRMQSATSAEKPSRGSTRTTAAQSVIGSSGRCCNVRQPPPQSAASRRQRHGKPPCRLTRPCFRARSFGSGSDG